MMKTSYPAQQGSTLLETLIAILIFSLGILSIVGLQATSVKLSSDAKYRSDANLLVNQIIAKMWVSDHTALGLKTQFEGTGGTGGTAYNAWVTDVTNALPGVAGNEPTISVFTSNATAVPSSLVTVTVRWKTPGDSASPVHQIVGIAQII